MTWRVKRQDWVAGHSLHRSDEDAFAFEFQHKDSPNTTKGRTYTVNVNKSTYDAVYSSQFGIWGKK
jgi:hypothetical protein